MGTVGMKHAGLVVLMVVVVVLGWRLAEVTREKTSIEERARTRSEELRARLETAGDSLEQARNAHDVVAERAQELEAEVARERSGRAAAEAAEEALAAGRAALEEVLAERSAEDERREERLEALGAELARMRATHEELARERERLEAERERFATELRTARSTGRAEHTRLATELSGAREEAERLAVERDDSREELEAVETEREELVRRAGEFESAGVHAREELALARVRLAKERDGAAALSARLESERTERGRIEEEHRALTVKLEAAEAERERFATELRTVRSAGRAEHTRLATELSRAREKAERLAVERDDAREELEAVEAEREELALARVRLAKERDGAAALSALRAALEAVTRERGRLALRLDELEGAAVALRRTVSTTAGELGRAQSKAVELTARYGKLLTEKATLDHLNEARLAELERIRLALEDAQSDVARLTNARGIYTVKEGDSLSIVAAFFYANGNDWPRIVAANRFLIGDNPDLIFEGMVLIIP